MCLQEHIYSNDFVPRVCRNTHGYYITNQIFFFCSSIFHSTVTIFSQNRRGHIWHTWHNWLGKLEQWDIEHIGPPKTNSFKAERQISELHKENRDQRKQEPKFQILGKWRHSSMWILSEFTGLWTDENFYPLSDTSVLLVNTSCGF